MCCVNSVAQQTEFTQHSLKMTNLLVKGIIMTREVYRRSLTYSIIGVVASLLAFTVGIVSLRRGEMFIGCLLPIFSVILLGMVFTGLKDNRPRVILDVDGISAREWGGVKILWSDIRNAKIVSLPRIGSSISLELYDEAKYLAQLTEDERFARKMSKWFKDAPFSFMTTSLDASTSKIYESIMRHVKPSQV